MAIDTFSLTVSQLLAGYGAILDELRRRDIVRSTNSPLSDYAELLFCKAFGWHREANSASGHDAVDGSGLRYQIKGRRLTKHNASRQLSAMRKLDTGPFDILAGLLVDADFQVLRAVLLPVAVVQKHATFVAHTNSWKFYLRDDVWLIPDAKDVTSDLRAVAQTL